MANIILPLFEFQQVDYGYPILEPLHSILREAPIVSEKDLRTISMYLEPRDCDPKSVV